MWVIYCCPSMAYVNNICTESGFKLIQINYHPVIPPLMDKSMPQLPMYLKCLYLSVEEIKGVQLPSSLTLQRLLGFPWNYSIRRSLIVTLSSSSNCWMIFVIFCLTPPNFTNSMPVKKFSIPPQKGKIKASNPLDDKFTESLHLDEVIHTK